MQFEDAVRGCSSRMRFSSSVNLKSTSPRASRSRRPTQRCSDASRALRPYGRMLSMFLLVFRYTQRLGIGDSLRFRLCQQPCRVGWTARALDARTFVLNVSACSVPPVGHRVREQAVRQGEAFAYAHHVPSVAFAYRPPVPVLMRGGGEPDSYSASFQVRLLSKTRCRWVSSESRYANRWTASNESYRANFSDSLTAAFRSSARSAYA